MDDSGRAEDDVRPPSHTLKAWGLLAATLLASSLLSSCYASDTRISHDAGARSVEAGALGEECASDLDCVAPLSCASWWGNRRRACAPRCSRITGGSLCDDGSLCGGFAGDVYGGDGWCTRAAEI